MKHELIIGGMSCGHCVAAVREALEGVDSVEIEALEIGRASITADENAIQLARQAVEEDGYEILEVRETA